MERFFESAAESSSAAGRSTRAVAGLRSPTDETADFADPNSFLDDELDALDEETRALDDEQRALTPYSVRSRSPIPPSVEYNEDGRIAASSKGKDRAD
jgi:hypothetical protein